MAYNFWLTYWDMSVFVCVCASNRTETEISTMHFQLISTDFCQFYQFSFDPSITGRESYTVIILTR